MTSPKSVNASQEKQQKSLLNQLKDVLSGLRQFLATESPLRMVKNAFYLTLKALFVIKIFTYLP